MAKTHNLNSPFLRLICDIIFPLQVQFNCKLTHETFLRHSRTIFAHTRFALKHDLEIDKLRTFSA